MEKKDHEAIQKYNHGLDVEASIKRQMKVKAGTQAQMSTLSKSIRAKAERFDNSRESVYVKKLIEQNR